jgi:hypothetical protein
MSATTSDTVAAWATGAGVGLVALMLTWLIANRLAALLWDPPVGPVLAFTLALTAGLVTAMASGRKLTNSSAREPPSDRP